MVKTKKYWLWGGLIGLIVGVILYFLGWFFEYSALRNIIPIGIRYLITSPVCYSSLPSDNAVVCFVIFGLPANIIIFGVIGIVIGFIIQLIKKK